MKIGVSLPVHERADVLLNQIFNIYRYIEDPLICIHVSENSILNMDEIRSIAVLTGAVVNEERFATRHGKGLMGVHISNFKQMLELGGVDYLLLISSNEMLIKPNLEEYMSRYDLGIQITSPEECPAWHLFNRNIEKTDAVQKFMQKIGVAVIRGGQAEGQFFKSSLFNDLAEFYDQCFEKNFEGFETEEIIPATFFSQDRFRQYRYSRPITLQNYCININIDLELIEKIRSGLGYISGVPVLRTLTSPHIGVGSIESIFSVKRVDRNINEMRLAITNLKNIRK